MTSVIRPRAWLSLSLLILLAGSSAAQAPQPEKPEGNLPALLTARPIKEDPKDDELRKLLKARYNEVVEETTGRFVLFQLGKENFDGLADAAQRLVQSGLELSDGPAEKVALVAQYLELTKEIEKITEMKHNAGTMSQSHFHRARYQRLDAEIQLVRAKREADKTKRN